MKIFLLAVAITVIAGFSTSVADEPKNTPIIPVDPVFLGDMTLAQFLKLPDAIMYLTEVVSDDGR